MQNIYPLTIVADRYTGTYSHGEYTAWNRYPGHIPEEIYSDDVTCSLFFHTTNIPYGAGYTPEEAIEDLAKKLGL